VAQRQPPHERSHSRLDALAPKILDQLQRDAQIRLLEERLRQYER